jgi:Histidine kinase-, DNA gyrase B-, and HSP90-like ATPase
MVGSIGSVSVSKIQVLVSPEQMGKLFQAFSQAEISTSKSYGGTGLELVLSRRFCQMMGGAGADDYDIKPIEIDRLLGKIQSLLSKGTEP